MSEVRGWGEVPFSRAPGYGAELRDPDGYQINLWDEESMRQKGNGA